MIMNVYVGMKPLEGFFYKLIVGLLDGAWPNFMSEFTRSLSATESSSYPISDQKLAIVNYQLSSTLKYKWKGK